MKIFYFKFRFLGGGVGWGGGVGIKCQQLPFLVRAWTHLIFNDLLYQLKHHQICIMNSNMQRNTMSKYNWYCKPRRQKLTAFVFLGRLTNHMFTVPDIKILQTFTVLYIQWRCSPSRLRFFISMLSTPRHLQKLLRPQYDWHLFTQRTKFFYCKELHNNSYVSSI